MSDLEGQTLSISFQWLMYSSRSTFILSVSCKEETIQSLKCNAECICNLVTGVLLHWKPTSAWNSEAAFPLNFTLFYGKEERRNADRMLLSRFRLLKIFLETRLSSYLEILAIFPSNNTLSSLQGMTIVPTSSILLTLRLPD